MHLSPPSIVASKLTLGRLAFLILLAFILIAFIYSITTPIFEGYDEDSHFAFVQHVATGQGLPRQPASQYPHLAKHEANQPPLYYLLGAALTWWIPTADLPHHLRENPHAVYYPLPYHDNQNGLLHDDSEQFPYSGTVLAVHIARLLSILLGAASVYCTYALARTLFPAEPHLALGAMLVHALTPSFLFGSSLVNNDSLVTFTSALTLLVLARTWQAPFSYRRFAVLGIVLGAAALSKLSALWTWPFVGLLILLIAWRSKAFWRYVRAGILTFAIAGALSGWWYLRNWVYYGDITGLNTLLDIIGRRAQGFGLLDFLPETEGIRWSYWALFGWFNLPVAGWLYRVYDALLILALAGLILWTVVAARARRWALLGGMAFVFAWFLTVLVALVNLNMATIVAQGRLLFPAASAISILLVLGWQRWLPAQRLWSRAVSWIAILGMAALAVAVPFTVITPAYATPDSLTAEQVAGQVSQRIDGHFEDKVTLVGIGLDQSEVRPGEVFFVRACWHGEQKLADDYFVFVQLLADNDLIAAQKDTYHGLGIYQTSRWPAGVTFCESYPLAVRETTPSAGSTSVAVGLYRATGERLAVISPQQPGRNAIRVAGPRFVVPDIPAFDYEWGHRVALIDYQLSRTAVRAGDTLELTLHWRVLQPAVTSLAATVQIMDLSGVKIGQSDAGLNLNQPSGSMLTDQRAITIEPGALPGVYDIKLGVYNSANVQNLLLYQNQHLALGGGLLPLWQVRVQPAVR